MTMMVVPTAVKDSKRLAVTLRHVIQEGPYVPNDPFPSLRELARQYGAGFRVVRTAVDILVKDGLLVRRERSGTFVRRTARDRSAADAGPRLRCVTILERPIGTFPSFVRMHYLQGCTQALDAQGIRMRVMPLPPCPDSIPTVLSNQHRLQEQGCILVNIVDKAVFGWLREHKVPFVVQNYRQYPKEALPPHPSVTVNKVGGAFMATRRLIELGHRRIGYAGALFDEQHGAVEVYEGFVAALHCAGLEARSRDLLAFRTDDPATAHLLALPLMEGRPLPPAILAQTDATAIGILGACKTLGIHVPGDLSVVGFNDQAEAAQCDPPLTTVAVPRVQLGREAAETLLSSITTGPDAEPVSKVLECHLVERGSTGPAKS